MSQENVPIGRRERAKQDKRERIMAAAQELFATQGVCNVTTQEIADRADVAIGTLYLYASTKAELLIMVQNQKFSTAIEAGLAAASDMRGAEPLDLVLALIRPVVVCVREHAENGRTYLRELVFGDPSEPYRREGLALATRLEGGIARLLAGAPGVTATDAATLARVITAVIHISTTATIYLSRSDDDTVADIRDQVRATLSARPNAAQSDPRSTPRRLSSAPITTL